MTTCFLSDDVVGRLDSRRKHGNRITTIFFPARRARTEQGLLKIEKDSSNRVMNLKTIVVLNASSIYGRLCSPEWVVDINFEDSIFISRTVSGEKRRVKKCGPCVCGIRIPTLNQQVFGRMEKGKEFRVEGWD